MASISIPITESVLPEPATWAPQRRALLVERAELSDSVCSSSTDSDKPIAGAMSIKPTKKKATYCGRIDFPTHHPYHEGYCASRRDAINDKGVESRNDPSEKRMILHSLHLRPWLEPPLQSMHVRLAEFP